MFCRECGKQNEDDVKFCSGCGKSMANKSEASTINTKTKGKHKTLGIIFGVIILIIGISLMIKDGLEGASHGTDYEFYLTE